MDAAARFDELVGVFAGRPGVGLPGKWRGFGSTALTVDDSIFAMLHWEQLVVKLPAERVRELIDGGQGQPFGAGKGRPMREWVAVAATDAWPTLAEEALLFVSAARP